MPKLLGARCSNLDDVDTENTTNASKPISKPETFSAPENDPMRNARGNPIAYACLGDDTTPNAAKGKTAFSWHSTTNWPGGCWRNSRNASSGDVVLRLRVGNTTRGRSHKNCGFALVMIRLVTTGKYYSPAMIHGTLGDDSHVADDRLTTSCVSLWKTKNRSKYC